MQSFSEMLKKYNSPSSDKGFNNLARVDCKERQNEHDELNPVR